MSFEYDPAKSAANKDKHGIDFDAAQALWLDDDLAELISTANVSLEVRYLAIGCIEGRYWTAIFARRGEAIRIISVRRARKEEVRYYESN
jgi:uncharacterized DUF497 family protein